MNWHTDGVFGHKMDFGNDDNDEHVVTYDRFKYIFSSKLIGNTLTATASRLIFIPFQTRFIPSVPEGLLPCQKWSQKPHQGVQKMITICSIRHSSVMLHSMSLLIHRARL